MYELGFNLVVRGSSWRAFYGFRWLEGVDGEGVSRTRPLDIVSNQLAHVLGTGIQT